MVQRGLILGAQHYAGRMVNNIYIIIYIIYDHCGHIDYHPIPPMHNLMIKVEASMRCNECIGILKTCIDVNVLLYYIIMYYSIIQ